MPQRACWQGMLWFDASKTNRPNAVWHTTCRSGLDVWLPFAGTYLYMAPEILRNEIYDTSADVWSWGVLFAEILQQQPPYQGLDLSPAEVRPAPFTCVLQHVLMIALPDPHTVMLPAQNLVLLYCCAANSCLEHLQPTA